MAEPRRGAPAIGARDKLAFLLSLVPWLIENDRVTVDDAAAHFGVDPRLVRESVELIAMSGVPGDTASYQHGDLFDIAWDDFEERGEILLTNLVAIDDSPRFSAREAAALIAGLQYLSGLPEYADSAAIATLTAKLSRGASAVPSPLGVADAGEADELLALIHEAVERGVQLELDYLSARGARDRRRVDPLRVESVDADWYLRGWCHLRGAVRTFRLDRMSDVRVTADPIDVRPGELTLPDSLFVGSPEDIEVVLEMASAALPLLSDYLPADSRPSEHAGRVRAVLRVSDYGSLARLVSGMPGAVRVIEPPDAREAVAAWARRAAARYGG
ncbi:MAG: WYL domain-containing protein [Micrococcales bacterium]|nr:WYL domain-containing protein [Micrococcales bacterium]